MTTSTRLKTCLYSFTSPGGPMYPTRAVCHVAEMAPVAKVCWTLCYGVSFLYLLDLCENFSEGSEGLLCWFRITLHTAE